MKETGTNYDELYPKITLEQNNNKYMGIKVQVKEP